MPKVDGLKMIHPMHYKKYTQVKDQAGYAAGSVVYQQTFSVDFSYPVYFTHAVFEPRQKILASLLTTAATNGSPARSKVMVYIDSGLAAKQPELSTQITAYFNAYAGVLHLVAAPRLVPGGEQAKNSWDYMQQIVNELAAYHLDRQSYVLAIGGGSVLDMVGFAAAVFHRGLRLIRLPSTVLAQNDAGVGVKNGLNGQGIKNFVGSFAPPYAVINDSAFLTTLAEEHWRGGLAEAVKVALIKDREFFADLCRLAPALKARELSAMENVIHRCAVLHLQHIRLQGDPFEFGSSRPLDFGHWAAHRLEVMSGYRLGHGQAVAIGIALDSYYAMEKGLITAAELQRILTCLTACGLACWHPLLAAQDSRGNYTVLGGLEQFREHLGGRLCITLPGPIGSRVEVAELDEQIILAGITYLQTQG
jgi:3-dehydroquinate synthase